MMFLLLACTAATPADSAETDSEDSGIVETVDSADTGSGTTEVDPEKYTVTCKGTETYVESTDLGFEPPAPIVVEVWAHFSDWYLSRTNDGLSPDKQLQPWYTIDAQFGTDGKLWSVCHYLDLSSVDPSWVGFEIDQYVVYVKPL